MKPLCSPNSSETFLPCQIRIFAINFMLDIFYDPRVVSEAINKCCFFFNPFVIAKNALNARRCTQHNSLTFARSFYVLLRLGSPIIRKELSCDYATKFIYDIRVIKIKFYFGFPCQRKFIDFLASCWREVTR